MKTTVKLPSTHHYVRIGTMHDAGGTFVEWYADDDGGSGLGNNPYVQRWYVTPNHPAPAMPEIDGWTPMRSNDGPDRTDPGYLLD